MKTIGEIKNSIQVRVMDLKVGARKLPEQMSAVATLSLAGAAASTQAKVCFGITAVAGTVAIVSSTPVVVKTALAIAGGAFIRGWVSGFRETMEQMSQVR